MKRPQISHASCALLLAFGLGGCGSTYGTGQSPETTLFSEMTGGLLDREEKAPINYQPRAPLVMPPTAVAQLPAPAEAAETTAGDWPLDPDQAGAGARVYGDDNPRDDIDQAEYRRLRPLAGALPARPREEYDDGNINNQAYDIVHSRAQQEEFKKAVAEAEGFSRTERRYLTDPPLDYRQPASTAPTEFEEVKKGNILTRWFRRD